MSTMKKNNADVAVALQWEGTGAPRVTAKGRGETAARILELAQQHDVPVEHDIGVCIPGSPFVCEMFDQRCQLDGFRGAGGLSVPDIKHFLDTLI